MTLAGIKGVSISSVLCLPNSACNNAGLAISVSETYLRGVAHIPFLAAQHLRLLPPEPAPPPSPADRPRSEIRRLPAPAGARRRPRAPDHAGRLQLTDRNPWIVEAARKIRHKQFVLDGEAIIRAWTASPTSMPCTPASTTTRSSSVRAIFWSKAATTSASCLSTWCTLLRRSFLTKFQNAKIRKPDLS